MTSMNAVCAMVGLGLFAIAAEPIPTAPNLQSPDAAGVIPAIPAPLMHRTGIEYPGEALRQNIGGLVLVQVRLDPSGSVAAAIPIHGPAVLANAVLNSVVNWHFDLRARVRDSLDIPVGFFAPNGSGACRVLGNAVLAPVAAVTLDSLPSMIRARVAGSFPIHRGDRPSPEDVRAAANMLTAINSDLYIGETACGANGREIFVVMRSSRLQ